MTMLLLCLFSGNILASEKHWAERDLHDLQDNYQIEVRGDLDQPAETELQEKIFKLINITKKPQQELLRYKMFYYMVEALAIKTLEEEECDEILQDFKDRCEYCIKANQTLGKAKKVGILQGRSTKEGLMMAVDEPITRAEIGVLAVRYLKIREK